ncbi:DUF3145 domain-containing protein [Gryllotalpicola protaetiae]|uniref:DUF3145 domain-containing protein n=1 Tax=Gryllotalpicola protaetiae TaxID=2419771 RepID=A0A387BLM3_9MICO|nr:DUF3145 domain-containing protein [Gryllotalpicola protaetiae]AYG05055.1 DUF3145 domain-containing protein [Gryllotalpicola protaetiae]
MTALTAQARGVLFVHSSPRALCPHLEWAAGRALGRAVNFDWAEQPVLPGTMRAEFYWEGDIGTGAALASALRGWDDVRYEVTQDPTASTDGARYLHTPALGIHFAQTDTAGNVVIPEDRMRYAMELAGSDALALHRELHAALGQAWDDELEAFRHASDDNPVIWLHSFAG